MYIHEAIKKALEEGKCIARQMPRIQGTKIIPTNSHDCCFILINGVDKEACGRWNPTADDLMSEDWSVAENDGKVKALEEERDTLSVSKDTLDTLSNLSNSLKIPQDLLHEIIFSLGIQQLRGEIINKCINNTTVTLF